MDIRSRIIEFLDYKGISKYKFYKKTGLSNGFLDKSGAIGTDKCEIIFNHYPEINLNWLITGEGSMLKLKPKTTDEALGKMYDHFAKPDCPQECTNCKLKDAKIIELQEKLIKAYEQQCTPVEKDKSKSNKVKE